MKSLFEKEINEKYSYMTRNKYGIIHWFKIEDVLSAKNKVKKEILDELNVFKKVSDDGYSEGYYNGILKAKRIVRKNL